MYKENIFMWLIYTSLWIPLRPCKAQNSTKLVVDVSRNSRFFRIWKLLHLFTGQSSAQPLQSVKLVHSMKNVINQWLNNPRMVILKSSKNISTIYLCEHDYLLNRSLFWFWKLQDCSKDLNWIFAIAWTEWMTGW